MDIQGHNQYNLLPHTLPDRLTYEFNLCISAQMTLFFP